MIEDCCENCFYMKKYPNGNEIYAFCCLYPPTYGNNTIVAAEEFLSIKLDNWCGMYKKAPKAMRIKNESS